MLSEAFHPSGHEGGGVVSAGTTVVVVPEKMSSAAVAESKVSGLVSNEAENAALVMVRSGVLRASIKSSI